MKNRIIGIALLLGASCTFADNGLPLLPIQVDVGSKPTLQRGARIFMNYCSGCHSMRYLRYNRMAEDIGLTKYNGQIDIDLLLQNLVFTNAKPTDQIQVNMRVSDAMTWFGKVPPDLSLIARERGPSWLYTYLKSFYQDPARPFGTNNLLMPDVAMPNVLQPLQGDVIALRNQAGEPTRLLLVHRGSMDPSQFNATLVDLVTFLVYAGEPAQLTRVHIGIGVMLFMLVLLVLAYKLKQSYWRNLK